ncbi:ATP-binding protein [Streptomyces sp. NPDC050535]|uniref:ATP-binding protein n=1 Tax=Streptomyces sp. NPDC050535 TaxID=3365626 RepID=UPI0037A13750
MPLNGGDGCIAEARHLATDFLTHARTDRGVAVSARAMDLTQLVVSELVTNARKYALGPMLMELRIVDAMVEITVQDSVRELPVARTVDPHRVGQHGLEIVMAVAEKFHVQIEPAGKRVTACLALADESVDSVGGTDSPRGPA